MQEIRSELRLLVTYSLMKQDAGAVAAQQELMVLSSRTLPHCAQKELAQSGSSGRQWASCEGKKAEIITGKANRARGGSSSTFRAKACVYSLRMCHVECT